MDELGDLGDLGIGGELSLRKYSIALTSWLVRASIALTAAPSASEKPRDERVEFFDRGGREFGHFRDRGLGGERFEPLDFDLDAIADQPEFAEILPQRFDLAAVAPVERRQGRKRGGRHGGPR